jgi:hypothetical protein
VYTALREAEYRSTAPIPYWNFAPLRYLVPRQRRCTEALAVINSTLDELIAKCKALVRGRLLLALLAAGWLAGWRLELPVLLGAGC